jgi:hypothetical protein
VEKWASVGLGGLLMDGFSQAPNFSIQLNVISQLRFASSDWPEAG